MRSIVCIQDRVRAPLFSFCLRLYFFLLLYSRLPKIDTIVHSLPESVHGDEDRQDGVLIKEPTFSVQANLGFSCFLIVFFFFTPSVFMKRLEMCSFIHDLQAELRASGVLSVTSKTLQ